MLLLSHKLRCKTINQYVKFQQEGHLRFKLFFKVGVASPLIGLVYISHKEISLYQPNRYRMITINICFLFNVFFEKQFFYCTSQEQEHYFTAKLYMPTRIFPSIDVNIPRNVCGPALFAQRVSILCSQNMLKLFQVTWFVKQ